MFSYNLFRYYKIAFRYYKTQRSIITSLVLLVVYGCENQIIPFQLLHHKHLHPKFNSQPQIQSKETYFFEINQQCPALLHIRASISTFRITVVYFVNNIAGRKNRDRHQCLSSFQCFESSYLFSDCAKIYGSIKKVLVDVSDNNFRAFAFKFTVTIFFPPPFFVGFGKKSFSIFLRN